MMFKRATYILGSLFKIQFRSLFVIRTKFIVIPVQAGIQ